MATLADLLRAAASGMYSGTGGTLADAAVAIPNLARAATGYVGGQLGLLAPNQLPSLIDPSQMPGTSANVKGLLGVGNSTPEQIAELAGGLLAPGGKAEAPAKLDMTVYHGTPHTFDQFDMSKIGTGEGAQAFGHGLYFADNPAVAKQYATDRSYVGRAMDGIPDTDWNAARIAQDAANVHGADAVNQLQKTLASRANLQHPSMVAENQKVQDAINMLQGGQVNRTSNLYKVDIPDDAVANMLHWDKPLSQQAPSVQAALGASDKEAGLVHTMPDMTGQQLYNELSLAMGGRDKAASFLNQQGIPGIRYLDAGSRGVGDGTYNTVLFNDQLANILGRE